MIREIKMGQLDGRVCKYSYKDTFPPTEDDDREIIKKGTETMDTPAHDDLRNAFKDAIPHFILLCGQLKETKEITNAIKDGIVDEIIPTTSIFFNYNVEKFEIKGMNDNEGVTFTGTRILEDGGILTLKSPTRKFSDLGYEHSQELIELVEVLKEEVYQYTQGKRQPPPPDPQTGFDFDASDLSVVDMDDNGDI